MGTRHPNPRLAKIHRNYTVEEVANVFGVHRNTVRQWIKGEAGEEQAAVSARRTLLCPMPFTKSTSGGHGGVQARDRNPGEPRCDLS
jgi:hypothetical protein